MRVRFLLAVGLTAVLGFFMFQSLSWADAPGGDVYILATEQQMAVNKALTWVRTQQQTDGSFGSVAGMTLDVVLALKATNEDPNQWTRNGNSPVDYLEGQASAYATAPASTGKMLLGALGADRDPQSFGGENLVSKLHGYYNPATGQFSTTVSSTNVDQAYAMLALAAARQPVTDTARTRLTGRQTSGGGWCWDNDSPWGCWPDYSTTSQAMQALIVAGEPVTSTAMVSATLYLSNTQMSSGTGAGAWGDGTPRAYDTAPVVQALIAEGENPAGVTWTRDVTSGFTALLALQGSTGAFPGYDGTDNLMATAWAVPALMGKPFPLWGRVAAAKAGLDYLALNQNADGGWGYYSPPSSAGLTCDVVYAIASDGQDPNTYISSGGKTPIHYLKSQASSYCTSAGATGKVIVAAVAADASVLSFGGINLKDKLASFYNSSTGVYGYGSVSDQAWAIIALAAMREPIPAAAVTYLQGLRSVNYSWSYFGDASYGTGLALMALRAAGQNPNDFWFTEGMEFFQDSLQNNDGGFPPDTSSASNINATGFAMQGILAGDGNLRDWRWTKQLSAGEGVTVTVNNPVYYTVNRQESSGAFEAQFSQIYATAQIIPPLLWQTFPIGAEVTSNTLVAGDVSVSFPSCADMLVQAPFEQDLNGNGTAAMSWSNDVGGVDSDLDMVRGSSWFTYTLPVSSTAHAYTVTVVYSDTDGVEGTNPQTVTVSLDETWPGTVSAVQECNTISVTATYCGDRDVDGTAVMTYTHSSNPSITGSAVMVKDAGAPEYRVAVPVSTTAPSSQWQNYGIEVLYMDPDGVLDPDTRNTTVSVDELLEAAFSVSPSEPVSGTITTFTDQSSGGTPTAWQWDFGDGGAIATTQNPTHTYAMSATVTVVLTTTFGSCGDFIATQQVTVTAKAQYLLYLPVIFKNN